MGSGDGRGRSVALLFVADFNELVGVEHFVALQRPGYADVGIVSDLGAPWRPFLVVMRMTPLAPREP